jgi:hypothetical protein
MQGIIDVGGPPGYAAFVRISGPKLDPLPSATRKYELISDVTLYSVKGNGLDVLGAWAVVILGN